MSSGITLQTLQARMAEGLEAGRVDDPTARRLWWAALETLQAELLPATGEAPQGLWIAAPLPALYDPGLLAAMQGWAWTPDQLDWGQGVQGSLLPPDRFSTSSGAGATHRSGYQRLTLLESDGVDPFLIVITAQRQVALALHGPSNQRQLLMRSDPETLGALLTLLDLRLQEQAPEQAVALRQAVASLGSFHEVSGGCLDGGHTVKKPVAVGPDRRKRASPLGTGGEGVGESLSHPVERLCVVHGVTHRSGIAHGGAHATHVDSKGLHQGLAVRHDVVLRLEPGRGADSDGEGEDREQASVGLHGSSPGLGPQGSVPWVSITTYAH